MGALMDVVVAERETHDEEMYEHFSTEKLPAILQNFSFLPIFCACSFFYYIFTRSLYYDDHVGGVDGSNVTC